MSNNWEFGKATFESSSSEKSVKPKPVVLKLKSAASFGTASFVTVIEPRLVFVKVTVITSPASTSIVATPVAKLTELPLSGSSITNPVRSQPATADSVTIGWPSGYMETYTAVPADRRVTITELSVVAVGEAPERGPAFQLAAATANPAPAGPTRFLIGIPRAARVRLAIFDVRGRLVAKLVDTDLAQGFHPVEWSQRDGRGVKVASGVYVARLEALGQVRTTKVVLLR